MLEPQLSWLKLACLSLSYSAKIWQIPKSSSSFRFPALSLNFPDFNFPTFEIFNFLNLQLSKFFSLSAFQIFQLSMFDCLISNFQGLIVWFPNLPTFKVWFILFDWLFDLIWVLIVRFWSFDLTLQSSSLPNFPTFDCLILTNFDCLIWLSSFLIAGVF